MFRRTVVALWALYAVAAAGHITVVSSFDAEIGEGGTYWPPLGIAYDGTYLWTSHIYRLAKWSYPSGSLIATISIEYYQLSDISCDGNYIYGVAEVENYIYKIDPTTGSTIGTVPTPPVHDLKLGLAYGAGNLWTDAFYSGEFWRLTTTGSVIWSATPGIFRPAGLAYDDVTAGGPYLWCINRPWGEYNSRSYVYQLTTAGSIIGSAFIPTMVFPGGHGLTFDGEYLWCIYNYPLIYHHALQLLYQSDEEVAPASWGRIKATFR